MYECDEIQSRSNLILDTTTVAQYFYLGGGVFWVKTIGWKECTG